MNALSAIVDRSSEVGCDYPVSVSVSVPVVPSVSVSVSVSPVPLVPPVVPSVPSVPSVPPVSPPVSPVPPSVPLSSGLGDPQPASVTVAPRAAAPVARTVRLSYFSLVIGSTGPRDPVRPCRGDGLVIAEINSGLLTTGEGVKITIAFPIFSRSRWARHRLP